MSDHRAILEAERRKRAAIRSERARFDRAIAATEAAIAARRTERIQRISSAEELDAWFARIREGYTVPATLGWPSDDLGRPVDP